MVSLKNKKGFTIVELLIVIVVIGILATLVIVTFTGIQQKARNTERKTDINAVASHVEAFYAETGSYPTLTQLQTPAFVSANMKGLKSDAFDDPKGTKGAGLGSAASSTQYSYAATGDGGAACDVVGTGPATTCTSYTLTATMEDSKTTHDTYVKSSN